MRTVTNYYLFNLSVSDLLLLIIGLPQETYFTWHAYPYPFGETFCRLRFLAAESSCYVSILTITAFTVERYMAICHPIKCPTKTGLSRPIRVILTVWVVSVAAAIPVGLQFGIQYYKWRGQTLPGSETCDTYDPKKAATVFQVGQT
ncbi:pyrokinin-1 receptor [Plakobranchus ocellatus]|uniref:Pyrokinin-1 receptor n=1 Tax=Plakobranchus ocellatus TaxID=259542 RepID=A0AAV4A8T1_9GAST|nr:pyrokinin-1 receptor [Plakobranchus ocellatus]